MAKLDPSRMARFDRRAELERVAVAGMAHARAGTIDKADAVVEIDASVYTDPSRFRLEVERIFRRLPIMAAASVELPAPGAFKAMEIAGIPLLLTRAKDGAAQALLNVCTHRGAIIADGCGQARRLSCPYHGWSFDLDGKLVGVSSRADFGDVDASKRSLRRFPVTEKAGLIWVILDPASTLDFDAFLSPFADLLEAFDLGSWHFIDRRILRGANWKLAFDAHPDWYHLPVLHRDSFGPATGNRALYHFYGPHQRMFRPNAENPPPPDSANLFKLVGPSSDWPDDAMMVGGWIGFPSTTMYTIYSNGGRMLNVNQILPGSTVDESFTIQTLLSEQVPDEALRQAGLHICDFIESVVRDEDLVTSFRQQKALATGLMPTLCLGRNEGGVQHFHKWVELLLHTPDAELAGLFA